MHDSLNNTPEKPQSILMDTLGNLTDQRSSAIVEFNKNQAAVLLYELAGGPDNDEVISKLQSIISVSDEDIQWDIKDAMTYIQTSSSEATRSEYIDSLIDLIEYPSYRYTLPQTTNAVRIARLIGEDEGDLVDKIASLHTSLASHASNDESGKLLVPLINATTDFLISLHDNDQNPSDIDIEADLDTGLASGLTYILKDEHPWRREVGDDGGHYIAGLLYEFASNPGDFTRMSDLVNAAYQTEDEMLIDYIDTIIDAEEGEELQNKYLEGLKSILLEPRDKKTPNLTLLINTMHIILHIKTWELSDAVASLQNQTEEMPHDAEKRGEWYTLRRLLDHFFVEKSLSQQLQDSPDAETTLPKAFQSAIEDIDFSGLDGQNPVNPLERFIGTLDLDGFTGKKDPTLDVKNEINKLDLDIDNFDSDVKE